MPITANPLSWIIAPPYNLWQHLPSQYHFVAGLVWLGFVVVVFGQVNDERKLGIFREKFPYGLRAVAMFLVCVFGAAFMAIPAAVWPLSLPMMYVMHRKANRDFLRGINRLLGGS